MIYIEIGISRKGQEFEMAELGIAFTHNTKNVSDRLNGVTFCDITMNGDRIATGMARCVVGDNFMKSEGRKLALKRALEEVYKYYGFPTALRSYIWEKYFETMK